MENNPFVSCPYNPAHRVTLLRLQAHIVKCQEKYPPLAICPYNATHRMSEEDMRNHVKSCPMREVIFGEVKPEVTGALSKPKFYLQKDVLPETDPNHEMWDEDN